jgi:PKD repeat protein
MKANTTVYSYRAVFKSLLLLSLTILGLTPGRAQAPLNGGSTYYVDGFGVDVTAPKDTFMNLGGSYSSGAPTNTTGIMNYLNVNGLNGSSTGTITILLLSTYSGVENTLTGSSYVNIGINNSNGGFAYMSAQRPIVIKPAPGVSVNITTTGTFGTANTSLIRFNAANWVTIDGESTTGQRNISFSIPNGNSTSGRVIDLIPVASNGIQYVTIRNTNIKGYSSATSISTFAGIYLGGMSAGSNAASQSGYNTFENNEITAVQNGIYLRGVTATTIFRQDFYQIVRKNIIGGYVYPGTGSPTTFVGGATGAAGVVLMNNRNATVEFNTIRNSLPASTGFIGISLSNATGGISLDSAIVINGNKIYNINSVGSSAFGIRMNLGGHSWPLNIRITNNVISNITASAGGPVTSIGNFPTGISIEDNAADIGVSLFNNTIHMYGNVLSSGGGSACLAIGVSTTAPSGGVISKNNIFVNRMGRTLGGGGNMANIYGVVVHNNNPAANPFIATNYNNYYINTYGGGYAFLAYAGGGSVIPGTNTNRVSLANWRAHTGDEANSRTEIPAFIGVDDTTATMSNGTGSRLGNAGQGGLVSADINGVSRPSAPSIGAHQFTQNTSGAHSALAAGSTYNINGTNSWPTVATPAGSFATVSDAVSFLNAYGVSGNGTITLSIGSSYAGEDNNYIPAFIDYPGQGGSRRVVLKPASGVTATLTLPNVQICNYGAVLRFMGTANVTVDGESTAGARNLTIAMPSAATAPNTTRVVALVPSEVTPTTGITIRNTIIQGNSSTTAIYTYAGIFLGNYQAIPSLSAITGRNDNNSFINNGIQAVQNGIYLRGVHGTSVLIASGNQDRNNRILMNTIGGSIPPSSGQPTTYIGGGTSMAGIYLKGQANTIVDSNTIRNTLNAGSFSNGFRGIDLDHGNEAIGRDSNIMVTRNMIYNLNFTNVSVQYAHGIRIAPANDEERMIYIANNSIAKIGGLGAGNGYSPSNPAGIFMEATGGITNAGISLYNNTVNMQGATLSANSSSAAVVVGANINGGVIMKNNLLVNKLGSGAMASATRYGVLVAFNGNPFASATGGASNNNLIYAMPPNTLNSFVGANNGGLNTAFQYSGIVNWGNYTEQDGNSWSYGTGFENDSLPDVELTLAGAIVDGGTPAPGVTTDIYGKARPTTNPNIGAVEFDAKYSPFVGFGSYFINGTYDPPTLAGTPGASTGSFPTVNRAIEYLNANGVNSTSGGVSPIQLIIDAGYIGEGDTMITPIYSYRNMGPNRPITLRPNASRNDTIRTSSAVVYPAHSSVIRFNGAQHFTIDGSNNGTNSRNLTIMLPSNATASTLKVVDMVSTTGVANTNNGVRNTIIIGNSNASNVNTFAGIYMGGVTTTPTNPLISRNDNNTFDNNMISAVRYGIYLRGLSAAATGTQDRNNQVTNNIIGGLVAPGGGVPTDYFGSSSAAIDAAGILFTAQSQGLIEGNTIRNNIRTGLSPKGIELNAVSGTNAVDDNIAIRRNNIYNIITNQTAAYGILISLGTATNRNIEITNNSIAGIEAKGSSITSNMLNNPYGIFIDGTLVGQGLSHGTTILNNSINLGPGTTLGASSTAISAAVGFNNAIRSGITLRNNILQNRLVRTNGSGAYGVLVGSVNVGGLPVNPFTRIDNNNYFAIAKGQNLMGYNATSGVVTTLNSIPAVQNYTKQDTMSINFIAPFTSDIDLSFGNLTNVFEGSGYPLSNVTTDIIGTSRNVTMPDMGAYEFTGTYIDSVEPRIYDYSLMNKSCGSGPFPVDLRVYERTVIGDTLYYSVNGVDQTPIVFPTVTGIQRLYTIPIQPNDASVIWRSSITDGSTQAFNKVTSDTFSTSITVFPYAYGFDAANLNKWYVEQPSELDGDPSSAGGWMFPTTGSPSNPNLSSAFSGVKSALFPANSLPNGLVSRLVSPCLDLTNLSKPTLRFWMSENAAEPNNKDEVIVRVMPANDYTTNPPTFKWVNGPQNATVQRVNTTAVFPGWKQVDVCLTGGISGVRVAFEGVSKGGNNILIDSIVIFDNVVDLPVSVTSSTVCGYDSIEVTINNTDTQYQYALMDSIFFSVRDELANAQGNGGTLVLKVPALDKDSAQLIVEVRNRLAPDCSNDLSTRLMIKTVRFGSGTLFAPGTPFTGVLNTGTAGDPDAAIVGDTLTYTYTAPAGLTDASYGTDWTITNNSIATESGTPAGNVSFTPPGAGPGMYRAIFDAVDADSTYILTTTVRLLPKGCDTVITRFITVTTAPVVMFSSVDSVCSGTAVDFTNSSTTSPSTAPITWSWDFGDGSNVDTVNFNTSHTYTTPGVVTARLTVRNKTGIVSELTKDITVLAIPDAGYTTGFSCSADTIQFTNTTTGATGYEWTLGTEGTSAQFEPRIRFSQTGTFSVPVILVAVNAVGCTDTFKTDLQIFSKPVASFSIANHCSGVPGNFVNTTSIDSGTFGSLWIFGDGNTGLSNNPNYAYDTSGTFTVKLITTSNFGCQDSTTRTVTVYERPRAQFTIGTATACQSDTLNITNTTVFSGGLSNVTYTWDFGDNTAASNATNPQHAYGSLQTFNLKLVTEESINGCKDSVIVPVSINEHASNVVIGASTNVTCINTPVSFTNSSQPPIGQTISYDWQFGDVSSSTDASPTHSYSTTGNKSVTMTVTTSKGCSKTVATSVSVSAPPAISFNMNYIDTFTREFIASIRGLAQYGWDFHEGLGMNFSFGDSTRHIFNFAGYHSVTLKAIDANGCEGTFTMDSIFTSTNVGFAENSGSRFNVSVYPNPFANVSNIAYTLRNPAPVNIQVVDLLGRTVAEFNKGVQSTGTYVQELNTDNFSNRSGSYIIRLRIGDEVINRALIQAK